MAVTSNDIANQAINVMGDNQPPVTGQNPTWDQSAAGIALQKVYGPTVATVARQWGWDLARCVVVLALTGNPAPMGYAYEYAYPANGIEIWQLMPTPPFADPNNPTPIDWNVGNAQVGGTQTKVIWTNLQNAEAVYNNNPTEATWDPLFREAVVRLLASNLAMAIAGKPDTSQILLQAAAAFEQIGEGRPD